MKKKPFRDWSIRHKLTTSFLGMAVIAALAVSVPMGTFDYLRLKQTMARDLETLADVLARNSTAALTFHESEAARDVLQALQAEPSITRACIYTPDGKPFATYSRDESEAVAVPLRPERLGARFEAGRLIEARKVVLADETLGTIYIESDLRALNARVREYELAFAVNLLFALSLAFVLAARFQRPISRPLLQLVDTANAISKATDFRIRAQFSTRDEVGDLVQAFNSMLDQIELRDHRLREHREGLEQEVAARTAELSAKNMQLRLQAASLETAANSFVITDRNGVIAWTNRAFSQLTGYTAEEARGQTTRILNSGKQPREFYEDLWRTVLAGESWRGELVNRRKDGSMYLEYMTITPILTDGIVSHFIAVKEDITERKHAEEALRQAEEKYRAIFEDAVIGIFQFTPDGRPLDINRALAQMHGYDSPEQLMREVSNIVDELFVEPHIMEDLKRELEAKGIVQNAEVEIYRKDGSRKWMLMNMRGVRDSEGKIIVHEGTVEDITERKLAESRVQFLAYYDNLTGLPNRTLLQDRLTTALAGARRRGEKLAVLFIDLDRFKNINDSLGHSTGDLLLQEVAVRLKTWAREQDTVSRLGGDEFVIVLNSIKDVADAAVVAERIVKAITAECIIQGHALSISCSLGISIFPDHGMDVETLLKNADASMYCAKESGRNNFKFFMPNMNEQIVERLTMENKLRQALERNELRLAYQPQVEISTGRLIGMEALIRWQQPEMGLVSPDKFIRVAENSGLIVPIGEWVLRTACTQVREWQRAGLLAVPVAVNVSAVQFRHEGFRDVVREVIRSTGLDPQYLELELTESVLLTDADVMLSMLRELKAMGIRLSIDDFGTGYSSLNYLRQFPVTKLKIDRSFVQQVAVNPDDAAITGTIISMAKNLNLRVIAEGVETEEQMSFLREHHCDEIQGYYFSKPIWAEEFTERLRSGHFTSFQPGHTECRSHK